MQNNDDENLLFYKHIKIFDAIPITWYVQQYVKIIKKFDSDQSRVLIRFGNLGQTETTSPLIKLN